MSQRDPKNNISTNRKFSMFRRKKTLKKSKLSKLMSDRWAITLDPKTFRFKLQSNVKEKDLCIKHLSLNDIQKFGKTYEENEECCLRDDEYFSCVECDRWLTGMCFKHPLIFVKEDVPPEMPYTVFQTFPSFMFLAPSLIPGAGKGVFTSIDLPCGAVFGPYSGILSFKETAEKSGYSWQLLCPDKRRVWVDAIDIDYSNWMRYSNCARFEQEQNLIALLFNQNIYYYTYKPIPAYSELLTWYGADYGKCLKIPNAEYMRGSKAPTKKSPIKKRKIFRIKKITKKLTKIA